MTRPSQSGRARARLAAPLFAQSETELYIRFADVDMMHVVHHSAYLHWLEQIRFKFLHDVLCVPFAQLSAAGVALPLTSCALEYKQSFRFGDRPIGYARVELFKQAKVALHYVIYNGDTGQLATTAVTTHCFLGAGHQLLLRTPGFFADAMQLALQRYPDCVLRPGGPDEQ